MVYDYFQFVESMFLEIMALSFPINWILFYECRHNIDRLIYIGRSKNGRNKLLKGVSFKDRLMCNGYMDVAKHGKRELGLVLQFYRLVVFPGTCIYLVLFLLSLLFHSCIILLATFSALYISLSLLFWMITFFRFATICYRWHYFNDRGWIAWYAEIAHLKKRKRK